MSHLDEGTLHAFLDGELTAAERRQVDQHLAACSECRLRLEQAVTLSRRASALLAELEPAALQVPAWRDLEGRAAARGGERPRRPGWQPALAWAASVVLAFGIGWLARSSGQPSPDVVAERIAADRQPEVETVRVTERRPESPAEESSGQPPAARMESDLTQDEPRGRASVPGEKIRENASRMAAAAPAERPSASATARLQPSTIGSSGPSETAPTARLKAGLPAQLDEAASWLGAKLRTLPDLELRRVELMPGSLLEGGSATSRTVRLVYTDAAGHQLVLVQQRLVESADLDRELPPLPRVEPGGYRSYTWRDGGGYLLSLQGEVGSDSLRALAERVE